MDTQYTHTDPEIDDIVQDIYRRVLDQLLYNQKGTILVGKAIKDPQSLVVGDNDDVLIADSTTTLGVKWGPSSAVDSNKIKVSSDDTTADFLLDKLIAGTGITLTELSGGGDEDIEIKLTTAAVSDHGALTGKGDDDHVRYVDIDGTRALTGDWDNITKRIRNTGVSEVTGTAPTTPATGVVWLDTAATGTGSTGVLAVTTKTTTYTITTNDTVIICDATSGAFTVTLPTAVGNTGRRYFIKKIDVTVNAVTVDGDGTETIDDGLTAVLNTQYEAIGIVSDGTEWWII